MWLASIVIIIALMLIIGIIAIHLWCNREINKISFKESMNLVNLPVITFTNGDLKLNFLFDSGADGCHIIPSVAPKLTSNKFEVEAPEIISCGDNKGFGSTAHQVVLTYNNKNYECVLMENSSLEDSMKAMKRMFGVNIHGLLGTSFLNKYNYVLDFKNLVAYNKK